MSWMIALTVVLVVTALLLDEKKIDIYAPIRTATTKSFLYLGEHNAFGRIVKKGLEVRKKELRDDERAAFKKMLIDRFTKEGIHIGALYGSGENSWDRLDIRIMPHELHNTRIILRDIFGSWNDSIHPGYCTERNGTFLLQCNYVPKEELPFQISIEVDYDIDNLPPGLLKEGCKVEKEITTRVTCSVVCT